MKLSSWSEASIPALQERGFRKRKPHEFVRVLNGVVQVVSFQGKKKDIHIWVNALPLSLPELNLNQGWLDVADRAPGKENTWNVSSGDEAEIHNIQNGLRDALLSEAIPKLDRLGALQELHGAFNESFLPFAAWPKAFCMLQLGELGRAKEHLQEVLSDPIRWPRFPLIKNYLAADVNQIQALVADQIKENIKSLRLQRWVT
ncbi:MAG TPA: DUF4304 domain-containing protein [Solimonas sp.]|nr:DUF4304 domain-containing protein [Solimonas sp.]